MESTTTYKHEPVKVLVTNDSTRVDTRFLKNGMVRLRFRLSPDQLEIVDFAISKALDITGYRSEAAALDIIFLDYLSGHPGSEALASPAKAGIGRRLFKLFPDQYQLIRAGLDIARNVGCANDAEALTHVCVLFLLNNST